jgi:hypothetical protein
MPARTYAIRASILLCLAFAGCVRREGRNAGCRWPGETPVHSPDAWHLSADAEFAEDLAIRYADAHHGLRTPGFVSREAYGAERDRCMASLFGQIAKQHGVPVSVVVASLGGNRNWIDLAMDLPFLLLYCLAAVAVARGVWRRYPPADHGWIPGVVIALFLSLAMAAAGTMLGELWTSLAETWRVGNDHMSHRGQRFWWTRHQTAIFAGSAVVFWVAALVAARSAASANPERRPATP